MQEEILVSCIRIDKVLINFLIPSDITFLWTLGSLFLDGINYLKASGLLQGDSELFTAKSLRIPRNFCLK